MIFETQNFRSETDAQGHAKQVLAEINIPTKLIADKLSAIRKKYQCPDGRRAGPPDNKPMQTLIVEAIDPGNYYYSPNQPVAMGRQVDISSEGDLKLLEEGYHQSRGVFERESLTACNQSSNYWLNPQGPGRRFADPPATIAAFCADMDVVRGTSRSSAPDGKESTEALR
jgi:hypothetical protein